MMFVVAGVLLLTVITIVFTVLAWFVVECWLIHWMLGLLVTILLISFFDGGV